MHDGRTDHAVVIGAGMAGLLAARALADRFAQVTLVDRDATTGVTAEARPRRGVPQGKHAHALLAGGQRALEELLPGLSAELVSDGVPEGDMLGDYRLGFGGHWLRRAHSGLRVLSVSRPHLESTLRATTARLAVAALVVPVGSVAGAVVVLVAAVRRRRRRDRKRHRWSPPLST